MIEWHDVVGTVGVVFIVGSYFLLQLRYLSSDSLFYSIINGVGALLILVSLSVDFNLAAFVIEVFWLLISIAGIFLCIRNHK